MVYDINELRSRVDDYFRNTLSKANLGKWAEYAYYDLLKGGYIEIKKIVLYPFLKTLSSIHVPPNDVKDIYPCAEKDVIDIQRILHGERVFDFHVEMAIPPQVYTMFSENQYFDTEKREKMCSLKRDILCYTQNQTDGAQFSKYINLFPTVNKETETILDIIENYIARLCITLFDTDAHEVKRKKVSKLYPIKNEQNSLINKLVEYLDCYIGVRNFNIVISYRDGEPDMLLLV